MWPSQGIYAKLSGAVPRSLPMRLSKAQFPHWPSTLLAYPVRPLPVQEPAGHPAGPVHPRRMGSLTPEEFLMKLTRTVLLALCALSLCLTALPVGTAWSANNSILQGDAANQGQVYLNPQFRYQGASSTDGSRLRTQRIKETMYGMLVGDFNGDGKNEIAILGKHNLFIYSWADGNGRMQELGRQRISSTNENFSFRAIDLNGDKVLDFVIATGEEEDNRPYSFFWTFKGNRFREVMKRAPYFISVAKVPPYFTPTLVGQGWDSVRMFTPGVHIMEKSGDSMRLGAKLNLPKTANCFNFNYIPANRTNRTPQLVVLDESERLKIYQGNNNTLIHTTMERFSGSCVGMDHYKTMPGLGSDKNVEIPERYYAPMQLLVADIGRTGEPVLIMNKPVSTAAQVFDRYRYFPQGEIHALFWDGVGLGLKWKTRRIRGSVAAVDLADVNNDGVLELVVGLNISSEIGVGPRTCMVTAYPLDLGKMNPNTAPDMSDFEVNPNF